MTQFVMLNWTWCGNFNTSSSKKHRKFPYHDTVVDLNRNSTWFPWNLTANYILQIVNLFMVPTLYVKNHKILDLLIIKYGKNYRLSWSCINRSAFLISAPISCHFSFVLCLQFSVCPWQIDLLYHPCMSVLNLAIVNFQYLLYLASEKNQSLHL